MGKIIISLTDDIEKKLREIAKRKYDSKRGSLSIIVEESLKQYLEKEKS
jgi:predicted transcriptional regulator